MDLFLNFRLVAVSETHPQERHLCHCMCANKHASENFNCPKVPSKTSELHKYELAENSTISLKQTAVAKPNPEPTVCSPRVDNNLRLSVYFISFKEVAPL